LLILVSLCVTRVGIVPSSTLDQKPSISPRCDSIQPISSESSFFAACGVALQRLVPLHEAVADVVESLDRFGQRLGEVGQLGLEFADSLAALAGQFGRIGLVVGDGVVDENRDGPIFAVAADVVQRALLWSGPRSSLRAGGRRLPR